MIDLNSYTDKGELFKSLKDNKTTIISQKKYEMKRADAVSHVVDTQSNGRDAVATKNDVNELLLKDGIIVSSLINTTNILDSHEDVHIPGLWNKSLKELKNLYLLQEHQMTFDHIISDSVKAFVEKMSWKELGIEYEGDTQALIFESDVMKSRNPYMFDQYAHGYVKNHSVGMRYVQLFLCINSDDRYYIEERDNWDKYIGDVANRQEAESLGYFWAVTEAKLVEGSAVPVGSNRATPTQSVKLYEIAGQARNDITQKTNRLILI